MKLLNDRLEGLLIMTKAMVEELEEHDVPAKPLDDLYNNLENLTQAIKDAVIDAYIEARGERK